MIFRILANCIKAKRDEKENNIKTYKKCKEK